MGLFGSKGEPAVVNQAKGPVANKGVYKQDDRKVLICYHCKKKSQMKDKCWILHPHLKPNKFKEPHPQFMDARAHFSNDGVEPATPPTPSSNAGMGGASASTSAYSAARKPSR